MAKIYVDSLINTFRQFEKMFLTSIFGRGGPPPVISFITASNNLNSHVESKQFSLRDVIGDGFLYAVPKSRRTIERKMCRRFGKPGLVWKPYVPKKLLLCNECGHHHELGVLCPNCYKITMTETKEMQDKIQNDLGLSPVENEVIVLYEGEKLDEAEEWWKNKRIVEMPKPRPAWFSRNLLQKTTQKPATSTDIEPSELA